MDLGLQMKERGLSSKDAFKEELTKEVLGSNKTI
jgi:hypothetical protein